MFGSKSEGEVAVFSAKRWDRRNGQALIESATPVTLVMTLKGEPRPPVLAAIMTMTFYGTKRSHINVSGFFSRQF